MIQGRAAGGQEWLNPTIYLVYWSCLVVVCCLLLAACCPLPAARCSDVKLPYQSCLSSANSLDAPSRTVAVAQALVIAAATGGLIVCYLQQDGDPAIRHITVRLNLTTPHKLVNQVILSSNTVQAILDFGIDIFPVKAKIRMQGEEPRCNSDPRSRQNMGFTTAVMTA